ncbi:hypothetical protein AMATHDRAFT_138210 [Amanita thiersii Skay4041]|uniref:Selenoprotein O n=1 Tax=Amanita thiersii Skay4041 TaxID=703135 RepID=A0A2A9NXG2_9AGAR|nr:hypothetical protein AMATHDRAFT_138210 [Amanita thiersii Skay4041]
MSSLPISALPLASSAQLLIHNLTPDPHTPSPSLFRTQVLTEKPSVQRRARLLAPQSHFSYVTPFPVPFPFHIDFPDPPPPAQEQASFIEKWLSEREATHKADHSNNFLKKHFPRNRDQPRILIGLAESSLKDCLPHLNVGDAFATLGAPSLSDPFGDDGDPNPSKIEEVVSTRQELIDVLSGYTVLMSEETISNDPRVGFAPWSLRYSGHQFGSWAGQLGDGRAISILVTPHPSDPNMTYELQLKGAGRTPFARTADGLAVLRSSIREYLCSEAMNALRIPTTRALSLISLPSLPVARERMETACILTRVAQSFIRIGSFEALNGPTHMMFFGGGQQQPHLDALRVLGEWVIRNVLKLNIPEGEAWGKALVSDVAQRNAKMVAAWQAYGFMHGVINTDNVSVLGLTIDYGPYAFMDVFDPFHICNHTDEGGRYAYKYQPDMIVYAVQALLSSLAPLIGAEMSLGNKAVSAGWADDITDEQLSGWRKKGLEIKDELHNMVQDIVSQEYRNLMRRRLSLRRAVASDESQIIKPLLDIMEEYKLDFHSTFRTLSNFRPSMLTPSQDKEDGSPELHHLISRILAVTSEPEGLDHSKATGDLLQWMDKFSQRIGDEREEWGDDMEVERVKAAKAVNPRFVLRQWLLEEVIGKVERDVDSGKRVLAKVMHMACNPFEPWGGEDAEKGDEDQLDSEEKEERRYCGLGDKKMLGFQCSCSS